MSLKLLLDLGVAVGGGLGKTGSKSLQFFQTTFVLNPLCALSLEDLSLKSLLADELRLEVGDFLPQKGGRLKSSGVLLRTQGGVLLLVLLRLDLKRSAARTSLNRKGVGGVLAKDG